MPPQPSPSAKANASMGLPDSFKQFSPFPFEGMNTEASPIAIKDQEFTWRENFIKLGDGNLRTAWDVGTAAYTAYSGRTIVWFGWYALNGAQYVAVLLDDGSAVQLAYPSLSQTVMAAPGTFYSSVTKTKPFIRSYGNQFILICNTNTVNDYWAWDGKLLYTAGTAAPNGVNILSGGFNYSSTPTVTTFGGLGSGMTFNVTEQGGAITEIALTSPGSGYEVGDVVQLAFSGGGSDTSPILIANLNSGGVGGVNFTAPGSGDTSATIAFSGGGGTGAAGTVILATGVISVPVTAGGTTYTFATVAFSGGGGTGAAATANIQGGVVVSITVTNPGSGYTYAPTATISGTGTGATAGTPAIGGGQVSGVQITNPGSGYVTAPAAVISGSGSGATAVAVLSAQGVQSVSVVNGGTNFTSIPLVSFVGGGGAGATGYVEVQPTSIARVNLTASGSGYNGLYPGSVFPPTISFVTGGSGGGASAVALMEGTGVGAVQMTSAGGGYTQAVQVTFTLSAAQIAQNAYLDQYGNPNGYQLYGGSGAGGTVVFNPTEIAGVQVSAAGQFYTSAPAVEVAPGANNSAYATVNLMPYGVSGTAIETFLSRVWIMAPATAPGATIPGASQFMVSAPEEIWDFATSDGGVEVTSVNSYLQNAYTGVRQSSGYLYTFGDQSVDVISNVATAGTPAVTTYNDQNTDPQAGLSWRDALGDFGRAVIIANTIGAFGLYGGAVTKISAKMDGVWRNASFPPNVNAVTPSAAIATIFDIKHYLLLMSVTDPDTGLVRTAIAAWNEKDWCVLSQSPNLTFIGTQSNGSTFNAWGTDGKYLYPLFSQPSTKIQKRLDTKAYGADRPYIAKSFVGTWMTASDLSTDAQGIGGSMVAIASGTPNYTTNPSMPGTVTNRTYTLSPPPFFASPTPYFATWGGGFPAPGPDGVTAAGFAFTNLALSFSSTSPDFVLGNWIIGYRDEMAII